MMHGHRRGARRWEAVLVAVAALLGASPPAARGGPPDFPQPDAARGPEIPAETGYLVRELADGAYWLTDGHYQMLFFVTNQGVVVVDAPRSLGGRIGEAIAGVTSKPVTHVVYSHFHDDHIGAAHQFPSSASIVAHAQTARLLEQAGDPKRPMPDVTFETRHALRAGDLALELHYPGPNHDVGNIIVYAPRSRVLMMVDVVWPGWVPFHSIGVADHIPGIFRAMDALLEFDFDVFVGGHANRTGTRADIETQAAYLEDVRAAAQQAYREVDFEAVRGRTGWERRWRMFDQYFAQMAEHCTAAVVPEWRDRLGGAEAFTPANCRAMAFSLWMD